MGIISRQKNAYSQYTSPDASVKDQNISNKRFRINAVTLRRVKNFIGNHAAERGGMIGRGSDGVIRYFEPDLKGRCSTASYDPDISHMNNVIKLWKKQGIEFCGFIHSHPRNFRRPSAYDEWYAGEILSCFKKLDTLWIPIVQTIPDTGRFELLPYAAIPGIINRNNCVIVPRFYTVVFDKIKKGDNEEKTKKPAAESLSLKTTVVNKKIRSVDKKRVANKTAGPVGKKYNYKSDYPHLRESSRTIGFGGVATPQADYYGVQKPFLQNRIGTCLIPDQLTSRQREELVNVWGEAKRRHKIYFQRLAENYDMDYLDKVRLIIVGTGGASALIRNCARMGIGEYILIDPDIISETNVATQDASPSAIGKSKVEAVANDVIEINPTAAVVGVPDRIESIDDALFKELITSPLRIDGNNTITNGFEPEFTDATPQKIKPLIHEHTILMVLTDNFYAQARGHRLGLHFGLPTICAQEYVEGIGAEVTYTVPGVTSACHRCITSSRYKAYIDNNYRNDVTSEGAPVFGAGFLNDVLGHILLAVIHHGTDHPRWGKVIEQLGNRNLLRLRMDNQFDQFFGNTFARRIDGANQPEAFFMLDTLFLPQTPDYGQSSKRPVCPDCGGTGDLRDAKGTFNDTNIMRREAR